MSATIMSSSEPLILSATDSSQQPAAAAKLSAHHTLELDCVKCDCCGLTEECTIAYIERIRERYQGKWICGLCAEAVKDEAVRCEERLISPQEALSRHLSFCKTFQSSPPPDPAIHMIAAMRQILRRSLESPKLRSVPCSPTRSSRGMKRKVLTRSESCIPCLSLADHHHDQVEQENEEGEERCDL